MRAPSTACASSARARPPMRSDAEERAAPALRGGTAALAMPACRGRAVDGLAVTSFMLPPDNVATVAEHFGLEARFLFQGLYGGASGVIGMAARARARSGRRMPTSSSALAADAFDVASHNETLDRFNGSMRDYMSPQGFGGANGMFALHTRLYMERYGATREDFGRFCIALARERAAQSERALQGAAHDGRLPERAADRGPTAALRLRAALRAAATRSCSRRRRSRRSSNGPTRTHSRRRRDPQLPGRTTSTTLPRRLVEASGERHVRARRGRSRSDMDFAQLYDDYPVMASFSSRAWDSARPGTAHRFVRDTDITVQGHVADQHRRRPALGRPGRRQRRHDRRRTKAVLQLLGRAGDRQVKCRRGLVAGYGMVAYGRGLCHRAPPFSSAQNEGDRHAEAATARHRADRPVLGWMQRGPPDDPALHEFAVPQDGVLSARLLPALPMRRP